MSAVDFAVTCPLPLGLGLGRGVGRDHTVQLAHGGGGRLTRELVEGLFLPAFGASLAERHDSAVLPMNSGKLAFTTDSYVVHPRFFPGGDIGKLAVFGTVNDLAMAGARPLYLSAAFILEEGLSIDELRRVVASMQAAAKMCGVELVTGDTKVVDRGKGDGLFINTAGIGVLPPEIAIYPRAIRPGDRIIVSGDVGRHGIAVLSVREGLAFESPVESDCGSLSAAVAALLDAHIAVHCLRDATRGGLATALNELALDAAVGIEVNEEAIPVAEGVMGACELLGLDPLYVACEGRMVAFVPEPEADRAVDVLRQAGEPAVSIGSVLGGPAGMVTLRTKMGSRRLLDLLSGEQLPRIC